MACECIYWEVLYSKCKPCAPCLSVCLSGLYFLIQLLLFYHWDNVCKCASTHFLQRWNCSVNNSSNTEPQESETQHEYFDSQVWLQGPCSVLCSVPHTEGGHQNQCCRTLASDRQALYEGTLTVTELCTDPGSESRISTESGFNPWPSSVVRVKPAVHQAWQSKDAVDSGTESGGARGHQPLHAPSEMWKAGGTQHAETKYFNSYGPTGSTSALLTRKPVTAASASSPGRLLPGSPTQRSCQREASLFFSFCKSQLMCVTHASAAPSNHHKPSHVPPAVRCFKNFLNPRAQISFVLMVFLN